MEWLESLDHAITLWINNHYYIPIDGLMIWVSNKFFWIPLYVIILFLFYKNLPLKAFLLSLPFIALLVVLTDKISVLGFKEVFERYRPCHNVILKDSLRIIDGCGGKFGFLSSHATNTAGVAVFSILVLRKNYITIVMVLYALFNSYSRIYLGKHYFSDVIAGIFLGAFIGWLVYFTLKKTVAKLKWI